MFDLPPPRHISTLPGGEVLTRFRNFRSRGNCRSNVLLEGLARNISTFLVGQSNHGPRLPDKETPPKTLLTQSGVLARQIRGT
jgi:hypothetical protein